MFPIQLKERKGNLQKSESDWSLRNERITAGDRIEGGRLRVLAGQQSTGLQQDFLP